MPAKQAALAAGPGESDVLPPRRGRGRPGLPNLGSRQARLVALVTGGARRLGAAIVRELHGRGMQVVVHYGTSSAEAAALVAELEARRTGDASAVPADLADAAVVAAEDKKDGGFCNPRHAPDEGGDRADLFAVGIVHAVGLLQAGF